MSSDLFEIPCGVKGCSSFPFINIYVAVKDFVFPRVAEFLINKEKLIMWLACYYNKTTIS